jgi:hypothetical protein
VLAHARALLTSSREGATAYLDADIKDTAAILSGVAGVLDFSQPVAVMLVAVLHMLRDDEDPGGIVTRLMSAVPPGSFLVVSHLASDVQTETMAEMRRRLNESMTQQFTMRTRAEVTASSTACGWWTPAWCSPTSGARTARKKPPPLASSGRA